MTEYKKKAQLKRQKLREEFWPDVPAWLKEEETGWFAAPRYLPLLLSLLGSKELSGNKDATRVYLELYSRHRDSGIVEMEDERQHAYAAGYEGSRAVRTWQERMEILEKHGFINVKAIGNQPYKYVLLVHPKVVILTLHAAGKTNPQWWDTYRARLAELNEDDAKFRASASAKPSTEKKQKFRVLRSSG
jgi:hypothetical protein